MNTLNETKNNIEPEYETIRLPKTAKSCGLCENYSNKKVTENNLIAILSCEGACLRGEVSRRVANKICFDNPKKNVARICLGGAFTKDTGQRNLVRTASRVIALEGCSIDCASRMMKGVLPNLEHEIIHVDTHYNFNKKLFGLNEVSESELITFSNEATEKINTILSI